MPSDNFGQQLSNIDFSQILGGPMSAAVAAEAQAAMVTLNYITQVGFHAQGHDGGGGLEATEVNFTYNRSITSPDGQTESKPQEMSVPVLSIVPIPALQVSQLSVDLNVKLNSITQGTSENSIVTNKNETKSSGFFQSIFDPVHMTVQTTDRSVSRGLQRTSEQYTLQVKMLATQAPTPSGLGKVLDIFEDAIESQAKDGNNNNNNNNNDNNDS